MALARASAARPTPEKRLVQAVSEFEASLSPDQKANFKTQRSRAVSSPPQIRDVTAIVAEIDRSSGTKVGSRCFSPRLINFLQVVQQFAALGDIVLGASQNLIACGVWAVARFTLQLCFGGASSLERLSDIFMRVGRSAPRYEALAVLYPRSKVLQNDLSEYFIVIVRLCQHIMKLARKSTFAALLGSGTDTTVKSLEDELEKWSTSIREQVSFLTSKTVEQEAKENTRFRAVISRLPGSFSDSQRMEMKMRWLNACSLYQHVTNWKYLRRYGNATVFLSDAGYQAWKDVETSATFVVTGTLGSGKSVLLANLVDDVHISKEKQNVAYFFCRYDDPESLKPRTVIGSFARQVLQFQFDNDEKSIVRLRNLQPPSDEEDITSVLQKSVPRSHSVFFVLDGLDECDEASRISILRSLRQLQESFNIRLCISVRAAVKTDSRLELDKMRIIAALSLSDQNPDIETFIHTQLSDRRASGQLAIRDPLLESEIQEALLKGAQGMFLWVSLQIDCICMERTDDAIRKSLRDLPKDLHAVFCRVLENSKRSAPSFQVKILKCLTAAYRPLTTEELREALSVEIGNTRRNPGALVNDIFATLSSCGSLVIVDEEELTVHLIHPSVRKFLVSGSQQSLEWTFTLEDAHNELAGMAVTYLSYGDFNNQVSRHVLPEIRADRVPSKVIKATLSSSHSVQRFTTRLLGSKAAKDPRIEGVLSQLSPSPAPPSTHYFFDYARVYWLLQSKYLKEEGRACDLCMSLINGNFAMLPAAMSGRVQRRNPFDRTNPRNVELDPNIAIMPDGVSEVQLLSGQVVNGRLLWAISNSHRFMFRSLLRGPDGVRTLLKVVPCLRHLLLYSHDFSLEPSMATKLLPAVSLFGDVRLIKTLIDSGADPSDNQARALVVGFQSRRIAVVAELSKGLKPGSLKEITEPLVEHACYNGDVAMVRLLLELGADLQLYHENHPASTLLSSGYPDRVVLDILELLITKAPFLEALNPQQLYLVFSMSQGRTRLHSDIMQHCMRSSRMHSDSDQWDALLVLAVRHRNLSLANALLRIPRYSSDDDSHIRFLREALLGGVSSEGLKIAKLLGTSATDYQARGQDIQDIGPGSFALRRCCQLRAWDLADEIIPRDRTGTRDAYLDELVYFCVEAEDLKGMDFMTRRFKIDINEKAPLESHFALQTLLHVAVERHWRDGYTWLISQKGANPNIMSGTEPTSPMRIAVKGAFDMGSAETAHISLRTAADLIQLGADLPAFTSRDPQLQDAGHTSISILQEAVYDVVPRHLGAKLLYLPRLILAKVETATEQYLSILRKRYLNTLSFSGDAYTRQDWYMDRLIMKDASEGSMKASSALVLTLKTMRPGNSRDVKTKVNIVARYVVIIYQLENICNPREETKLVLEEDFLVRLAHNIAIELVAKVNPEDVERTWRRTYSEESRAQERDGFDGILKYLRKSAFGGVFQALEGKEYEEVSYSVQAKFWKS